MKVDLQQLFDEQLKLAEEENLASDADMSFARLCDLAAEWTAEEVSNYVYRIAAARRGQHEETVNKAFYG